MQGRNFSEQEVSSARRVALINEAAVKLWPSGENPVGRVIRLNELEKPSRPDRLAGPDRAADLTVIGIIGNTLNVDLREETQTYRFDSLYLACSALSRARDSRFR